MVRPAAAVQSVLGLLCISLIALAALLLPVATAAQQNPVPTAQNQPRITSAIDESRLTTLRGNTHPLARAEFDRGAAPASLPMQRMLLVLKRGTDQETALDQLLAEQQDAASPNYHKWLTPQQFGQQFGPADQDIQTVTSWLQSHGFQVSAVSNGRTVIEFSGTTRQVQEAFHTEIHQYSVNGESHWANTSDPQIPAALSPVVAGVNTLYNFPRRQTHEVMGLFSRAKSTGVVKRIGTQFTFPDPCNANSQPFCNLALAPADISKIYNVPNLTLSPAPGTLFNGDGTTIGIVDESNIDINDVTAFRALYGLPAANVNVILSGPDPGLVPGAELESNLDVQLAGAVAPNATIDLIVAESTEVSLGADLAAQYAVDNNIAPILNESFGLCEFFIGTTGNTFYNNLWQQAAALGITVTVSSGDGGAAGCEQGSGAATLGLAVSGFTSTPYNVSVGGTDFNDLNNAASFWNLSSGDTPTVASAKSYIPEIAWDSTCTNAEIFSFFGTTTAEQTCNNSTVQQDGLVQVAGGGGGSSTCTISGQNETSCSGGYSKPSWQTALTPHDGKRDVPDISLFASSGFNGSFYLLCEADLSPGATSCDPYAPSSDFVGVGGTSASSTAFAGIMALVNQATGSRQGNANYVLYQLAAQSGNSCPSAANPAASCVFYDVPSGSTIAMPCKAGSLNCTVTNQNDSVGVLSGYATATGYDLATGLGSVNVANLITKWKAFGVALKPSSTNLTLNSGNPVTITHGQSVNVGISVTSGSGTPTGNVSLVANTGPDGTEGVQGFTLSSGSVSSTTEALPGGSYTVTAQYPGDGTFAPSTSSPTSVTVGKETSETAIDYELFDSSGQQTNSNATTALYGISSLLRINVTSQAHDACPNNAPTDSGCPTGGVVLTDNGNPLDGGTFALNGQGYTEDQLIELPVGVHNLAATYAGDNSFTGSGGTNAITVTKAATTTVEVFNPVIQTVVIGTPFGANGLTKSQSLGVAPTGGYTLFDGSTPLSATDSSFFGFPGSSNGTASCQGVVVAVLSGPAGPHSITIGYSGDANYLGSTSTPVLLNAVFGTQTVVTSSTSSIQQGQSVTFTAVVTPAQSGGPGLTGSVQFLSNGSNIGNAVAVTSGQARLMTNALLSGTLQITAVYSGDANYAASTSPPITETVSPGPTFTVSANPPAINISAPGQMGSTVLTLTSQNGLTGSGGLGAPTCGIAASEEVTCSLTAFTLPSNGSVQPTLTFLTTAPSMTVPMRKNPPTVLPWKTIGMMVAIALLLWSATAARNSEAKRRRWSVALTCTAVALLVISAGCGGGGGAGGGGGGGGNTNPGTPVGNVPLSVTITIGGVTQTVPNLLVTVQ